MYVSKIFRGLMAGVLYASFIIFTNTSCTRAPIAQSELVPAKEVFYQSLESLQGKMMQGQTIYPEGKYVPFVGQEIAMAVSSCTKNEMRIPIYIGGKIYRTLILERTPAGFLLKHENKKEDGRSNEINLYGGHTQDNGTAFMQFFPADTYTKNLMSLTSPSVWTLAFSSDRSTFSYLVESDGKLQMQIDFNLNDYLATTTGKGEQRSRR
ncbi:hypothetical protein [Adhaeribacter radiodurans]|uniref:DUF4251 domain-containing protein n=1 Tax=Adhaeribacter radiodurans TaxID=2745197 RepID=A0A7L7LAE1_9BACT|nr:hypothetical protein [Adhaeribacter radiodurans]QMU29790.1 hypothetical protein HUW48_17960 [Adhaeribacter radiodurans]